jgi:hypothetical protein
MCGSDRLETRRLTGFERFLRIFTNKIKYRCLICRHSFRAEDRRKVSREYSEALRATRPKIVP